MTKQETQQRFSLTKAQIAFITAKVKELGNKAEVYAFYKLQDEVSKFAHSNAECVYGDSDYEDDDCD